MIFRGSTPTLPIEIDGIDLSIARLFLTISNAQRGGEFTLTAPEDFTVEYDSVNKKTVGDVVLTQEQTLMLSAGVCRAQIRYIFPDGVADATLMAEVSVADVLYKDVISYE